MVNVNNRNRQAKGTPIGGQFAVEARTEPSITLQDPVQCPFPRTKRNTTFQTGPHQTVSLPRVKDHDRPTVLAAHEKDLRLLSNTQLFGQNILFAPIRENHYNLDGTPMWVADLTVETRRPGQDRLLLTRTTKNLQIINPQGETTILDVDAEYLPTNLPDLLRQQLGAPTRDNPKQWGKYQTEQTIQHLITNHNLKVHNKTFDETPDGHELTTYTLATPKPDCEFDRALIEITVGYPDGSSYIKQDVIYPTKTDEKQLKTIVEALSHNGTHIATYGNPLLDQHINR